MMGFWAKITLFLIPQVIFAQNRELVPTEAPTNLTLLEIRDRQVIVEWDPVAPHSIRGNFRGYVVRTWSHSGSQVYIFPADVTRASVEFFPYSKNFITVASRNDKYVGPPSEAISFDAPQLEPSRPPTLDVFLLSAKSVLITWSKPPHPNGVLLGYKIYCKLVNESTNNQNQISHDIFDPDKLQAKLTGMEEGLKYEIAVSAINCAGESDKKFAQVTLETHVSLPPTNPKFIYKIDYQSVDREAVCRNFLNVHESEINNTNSKKIHQNEIGKNDTRHCLVDLLIMWIPDIRNTPGEHFYVKYRPRGDKGDFLQTDPELSEDFTIIHDFNACRNYEIILAAVDGEFTTESDLLVTPTTIFR